MNGGTLDEAAIAVHEMFISLVRAGFTEAQALDLVKASLIEMVRNQRPEEE